MKKQLFSFVMMLAMVIVAGSVMAQTKFTPLAGGTYSYAITYNFGTGGSGSGALTVSDSKLTIQNQSPSSLATLSGSGTITFDIKYDANATGSYSIKLVLTDAGTGKCTNQVIKTVTIAAPRTLALAVSTTDNDICQTANGTEDNVPASSGKTNTIKYTVTPTTNADNGYSYNFDFAATPTDFGTYSYALASGTGTINSTTGAVTNANGPVSINVTWTTTTGLGEKPILGTISSPTMKTSVAEGNFTIDGSIESGKGAASVNIHSTPTIGTFN